MPPYPEVQKNEGMSELLRLSEGAVLTHLATRAELAADALTAVDDLRLWARLADGEGVPLAGAGWSGPWSTRASPP